MSMVSARAGTGANAIATSAVTMTLVENMSFLLNDCAASELEAERVRPAVVVLGKALGRLAVVVVEEPDPEIPVARQVEVEVEPIRDAVPVVNRQTRVVAEPRDEVGDLQLLGHELGGEVGLGR